MRIAVECARDAEGGEIPARLDFDSRSVAVAEILDRWPGPDYRYFKVIGTDGALYILRHDEARAEWELTMFQRRPASPPP